MRRTTNSWLSTIAKLGFKRAFGAGNGKRRTDSGRSRANRFESLEDRIALYASSTLAGFDGPVDRRIDLVFTNDGFTSAGLSTYQTKVEELVNGTSTLDGIFDFAPFDSYKSYFNVHRVDVISNQSGIDPSPTNNQFDTALDGYLYDSDNKFNIGDPIASAFASADAPDNDFVQIIFNGSGRANATGNTSYTGINNSAAVHVHEMGHSIGLLGDEYWPGSNPTGFPSSEFNRNLTSLYTNKQDMIAAEAKWYRWMINIDANQPADPAIDVFSGGGGDSGGLGTYRPSSNSMMRGNTAFDSVGKEAMVIRMYEHEDISTIDDATAEGIYYYDHDFFVDRMSPTHVDDADEGLSVNWYVDNTLVYSGIGEQYETFNPHSLGLTLGEDYTIKAEVIDNTYLVRDEAARANHMTATREWTFRNILQVTTEVDENGTNPDALSLREALALAANETTHPGSNEIVFAEGIEEIVVNSHLVVDSNVSIVGPGQDLLTINGNGVTRAFWVQSGKTASISGMSMVNGSPGATGGGAVFNSGNLTLNDVRIANNVAGLNGGGVYNNGTIRVVNSTIENNVAGTVGGGLMSHANSALGVVIENSAIIDNEAPVGGGLYLHVFTTGSGGRSAQITNSTISGNSATTDGGGVVVVGGTSLTVVQSTITDNHAKAGGSTGKGGGLYVINSLATLHNTIVADNTAESTYAEDFWTNWGLVGTSSYNLIGSDGNSGLSNGTNNNIVGSWTAPISPGLATLADNGGPTLTHALLSNSLAIDAGSNALAEYYLGSPLIKDQRGHERYFDIPGVNGSTAIVDIGAYERSFAQIANITLSTTVPNEYGTNPPYSLGTADGSEEQLRTIPVGAANRIAVQFTKEVQVGSSDLELIALSRVVTEPTATLIQSPSVLNGYTAIWALSTILPDAQYLLRLSDSIDDGEGYALDGEWTNPGSILTSLTTSSFPSGDNVAGGDFEFVLTYLRGDANRDVQVTISDFGTLVANLNDGGNMDWTDADFDGDGEVTVWDQILITATLNKSDWRNLLIRGDYDGDFDIDADDQMDFLAYFAAGSLLADLNKDQAVTQADDDAFDALLAFDIDLDVIVGTDDYTPAKVTNITISSTTTNTYGTNPPYSFATVDGSQEQLRTVPVGNANRIAIQFSKDVDISSSDLEIIALNRVVTEPTPTLIEAPSSGNSYTATWSLSSVLPDAQYLIRLADSILDLDGNALDGEWVNAGSILSSITTTVFPSGNNVAGGDFEFVFTYLRGDANRDLQVTGADFGILTTNLNQGGNKSWAHGDFTGDGTVSGSDLGLLSATLNKSDWRNLSILGDYNNDYVWDTIFDGPTFVDHYVNNELEADLNKDTTITSADLDAAMALLDFGIDLDVLV